MLKITLKVRILTMLHIRSYETNIHLYHFTLIHTKQVYILTVLHIQSNEASIHSYHFTLIHTK
jgi:hypothetical protein